MKTILAASPVLVIAGALLAAPASAQTLSPPMMNPPAAQPYAALPYGPESHAAALCRADDGAASTAQATISQGAYTEHLQGGAEILKAP